MHPPTLATIFAAVALVVSIQPSTGTGAEQTGDIRMRLRLLKKSPFEHDARPGPVLIGAQPRLEFEWVVFNDTGEAVSVSPSENDFALSVAALSDGAKPVPVTLEWSRDMLVVADGTPDNISSASADLPAKSSLKVRGSARRQDEAAFEPGDYELRLSAGGSPDSRIASRHVDLGHPIRFQIVESTSPTRQRQYHLIEGAFYLTSDAARAIQHYAALASLPGALWTDSLPLAHTYGLHGMHREAAEVYRRILPNLIQGTSSPLGELVRGHVRNAARSFAVVNDAAAAATLLRLEGRTPADRIAAEIERLRQTAPRRAGH